MPRNSSTKQIPYSHTFSSSSTTIQTPTVITSPIIVPTTQTHLASAIHSLRENPLSTFDKKQHIPLNSLRISLLGPPGSGKGTQSLCIKKEFGIISISTGDVLRDEVAQQTPLGIEIEKQMANGGFVSDQIMSKILDKSLFKGDAMRKGWVLDGYPRNTSQARDLDEMLENHQQHLTHVIYLKVDENEVVDRIKGRLIHPKSGRTYHLTYQPPKVPGCDDITGEPLVPRSDDNPEVVINRIRLFKEKTKPLLEYYDKCHRLTTIEAPNSKLGFVQIKQLLNEALNSNAEAPRKCSSKFVQCAEETA